MALLCPQHRRACHRLESRPTRAGCVRSLTCSWCALFFATAPSASESFPSPHSQGLREWIMSLSRACGPSYESFLAQTSGKYHKPQCVLHTHSAPYFLGQWLFSGGPGRTTVTPWDGGSCWVGPPGDPRRLGRSGKQRLRDAPMGPRESQGHSPHLKVLGVVGRDPGRRRVPVAFLQSWIWLSQRCLS